MSTDHASSTEPRLRLPAPLIYALTIIGYVADVAAVVSLLLTTDTPILFNVHIGSYHALGIWIIGCFLYLVFLQTYWVRNQKKEKLSKGFYAFITRDLFGRFFRPILLFPGIILFILFVSIAVVIIDQNETLKSIQSLTVSVVGMFVFYLVLHPVVIQVLYQEVVHKIRIKQDIELNWEKWDAIISTRLARKQYVGIWDLNDQAMIIGVHQRFMHYPLAKYSVVHPETAAYGTVYNRETKEAVSEHNALISLENIDHDRFSFSG